MQFIDGQTPGQIYTITDSDPPVISVPYPPNEVQPINLPLRLALSRLVVGIVTGDVFPGKWSLVTSLVGRDELELVFTTAQETISWQMKGINTPLLNAFCGLQGLKPIA